MLALNGLSILDWWGGNGGVLELTWKNDDLVLYHGCTDRSLQPNLTNGIAVNSPNHGISATAGLPNRDFGQGFYATSFPLQASSWANLQVAKLAASGTACHAVVLQFVVARDALAKLEALVFVTEFNSYWPFVSYCRHGNSPHGRTGQPQPQYDVVYGPVSLWEQPFVIKDCDQVSFHTPTAIAVIPSVTIFATGIPMLPVR